MTLTKAIQRKIIFSLVSTVVTAAMAYAAAKIKTSVEKSAEKAHNDKALNRDLVDSMDCSDPVAKY